MKPLALHLLAVLAFLGAALAPTRAAIKREDQLPLLLASERANPPIAHLRSELSAYRYFMRQNGAGVSEEGKNIEPFGLHLDFSPHPELQPPLPEEPAGKGKWRTRGPDDLVPLHFAALTLAEVTKKNVLLSARIEHRQIPEYRLSGTVDFATHRLIEMLEDADVEVRLLGHDTYVLFETPGKEREFDHPIRPRAATYEKERELWLAEHPHQPAQGLIYQPTLRWDLALATLTTEDLRVRHAAAILAKLSQKEVFVQATVEKRKFEYPDAPATSLPALQQQMIKQLERAYVRVVELGPNALGLTQL